jgi:hypothetical protein
MVQVVNQHLYRERTTTKQCVRSHVKMQWVYWVLEGVILSITNEFV